jgi:hypothetical protein
MTPMEPTKTPAQAEKERLQAEWCSLVESTLDLVINSISALDSDDTEVRAQLYRELRSLRDKVTLCPVTVRVKYNTALDSLFSSMDAIPTSFYLSEEDPKP